MTSWGLVPDLSMKKIRPLCVTNDAQQGLCVMKSSYVTHNVIVTNLRSLND